MSIDVTAIGQFEGKRVDEAVLRGRDGVAVRIMNWGVTVRDWQVPAPEGTRGVVLGFEAFEPYPEHSPHLGSLAGRVANRIGGAAFELDGVRYVLPANEGPNILHGGPEGLGRQVWEMDVDSASNAVLFSHRSVDGAMGFPGNVQFTARYSLNGTRLRLDLVGTPDRPSPISLVQHIYFNIGLSETVLDHTVHLPSAVAFTPTDSALLPTGTIAPNDGLAHDFRAPHTLRDAMGRPIDCDLNLVLATGRNLEDPIAVVTGEDGALHLKLWSDRPGLQLYNGVMTDIPVAGWGGRSYGKYSGLCLEDQMFPDALNHAHFPNIICTPDRPYRHWCEIDIGARA